MLGSSKIKKSHANKDMLYDLVSSGAPPRFWFLGPDLLVPPACRSGRFFFSFFVGPGTHSGRSPFEVSGQLRFSDFRAYSAFAPLFGSGDCWG